MSMKPEIKEPLSDKQHERQQRINAFLDYSKKLFANGTAPEVNSMKLPIDINSEVETGLLYELFSFGFHSKTKEYLESEDPIKIAKSRDANEMFNVVGEYIKAAGYKAVLKGVDRDTNGNVLNIRMSFNQN